MKRITTYIVSFLVLGLLNACKDDNFGRSLSTEDPGGPVTLNIGMMIPEAATIQTRALLDEAASENTQGYLNSLVPYMFIFEDTGNPESNYLRTLVHGVQIEKVGTDDIDSEHSTAGVNIRLQNFKATVDGTAENAIIHLVLIQQSEQETFEAQLTDMTDRSEIGMLSGANGLSTKSAAYWKRIELGKPINNSEDSQATLKSLLSHVKMVRNFAQIGAVKSAVNDFEIIGFVVVNGMNRGYIAAYNENIGDDGTAGFVEFEPTNTNVTGSNIYRYLTTTENYIPVRHPDAYRDNPDQNLSWLDNLTWNNNAKYMFERPVQDTHRTFIVLKAKRNGKETYYKLDIGNYDQTDETLQYNGYGVFEIYNLIRNISYNITITDVASDGHATPEEAIGSLPANNITASVDTQNIMSIGDGVDNIEIKITNIYSLTDSKANDGLTVVIINDDNGAAYPKNANILWQYTEGSTINNNVVHHDYPGNEFKTGGVISSYTPLTETGWNGYALEFNDPSDIPLQETVKFYKQYGLCRDVTFILRKRWEFVNAPGYPSNVEVYPGHYSYLDNSMPPYETLKEVRDYINEQDGKGAPGNVGSQRGAQFTVMFELPGDIPRSLFPLEFKIGFDRQPAENAYVGDATLVYGDSMFDGQGDSPRMQFIKTITWDYYNGSGDPDDKGHKIVTARFLTTTDVLGYNETDNQNGETSTTHVRVTNPYFVMGQDDFQRNVKEDDTELDANRTDWVWYFGDTGWTKYFNEVNTGHIAGLYNGLSFLAHSWGTQYGQYMGFNPGTNADTPELSFDVNNAPAPSGGYKAKLRVNTASLWYNHNGNNYRRQGYARIHIKDKEGNDKYVLGTKANNYNSTTNVINISITSEVSNCALGDYDKRNTSSGNQQKGLPQDRIITFDLAEGDVVQSIKIWTAPLNNSDKEVIGETMSLYYTIQFTLTPQ